MLTRIIRFAMLAGAGVAAWKAYAGRGASRPFPAQALHDGVAALEAARSAQLRGASAELRRFAQQMEHDHAGLARALADAAGTGIPKPDRRQRSVIQAIDQHQGEAYDRAWLRHMARCQGRAIRLYQREVDQGGAAASIAAEALPTLRAHDRKLAALRSGDDGATPAAAAEDALPG